MQPVGGGPSYDQLLAENRKLKEQLAARRAGIHIDVDHDRVSLGSLTTPELKIDDLQVSIPGLKKLLPELVQVSALSNPSGHVKMPDLASFARFPMKVESMDLSVTQRTLNQVLSQKPVPGMCDLHLEVGEHGRLKLSGIAQKLIPVPFEVEGRVAAAGGSRVRFDLEKTRLGGFLPIPNLMTNFFASLASHEMSRMNVTQEGDSYTVDLRGFMPDNILVRIDEVQTDHGNLRVQTHSDRA